MTLRGINTDAVSLRAAFAVLLVASVTALPAAAQEPKAVTYYNATFSPDSRAIAFESTRKGNSAIYTIDVDGTNLRQLTEDAHNSAQPQWSPDGRRIAFTSARNGASGQLFTIGPDGRNEKQLTSAPAESHFYPRFSPDGAWVAFGIQEPARRDIYYVGTVRSDGTGMRRLSDSTTTSSSPSWAPDGRRLQFTQAARSPRLPDESPRDWMIRTRRTERVVSMRPDGTDWRVETGVTPPPEEGDGREVSRDGRWSVMTKDAAGRHGIYITDLKTGAERVLVEGPAR